MTLALELINAEKKFGEKTVLSKLNLQVETGELLVVLGESGSGKSTLLKIIAGLERIQSGQVRVIGQDQTTTPPHRRQVAIIFQDRNGYDHLTVRQNLELASKNTANPRPMDYWIRCLGLCETMDQRLSQLSGGQLQLVAIARGMLSNKPVVLFDEPLAHLHPSLREDIREKILESHQASGKTFVYVTHDSDDAFHLASRIAVLASGAVQQIGSPHEIYETPCNQKVAQLLGQPTIDMIHLPRNWTGTAGSVSSGDWIECGVRSHDWCVDALYTSTDGDSLRCEKNLVLQEDKLIFVGVVRSCRWMGNAWLLTAYALSNDSPTPLPNCVRIRIDIKQLDYCATLCSWRVGIDRNQRGSPFLVVKASVPKSKIKCF
jgi:ABC-type sugar transport system ATPase subunit